MEDYDLLRLGIILDMTAIVHACFVQPNNFGCVLALIGSPILSYSYILAVSSWSRANQAYLSCVLQQGISVGQGPIAIADPPLFGIVIFRETTTGSIVWSYPTGILNGDPRLYFDEARGNAVSSFELLNQQTVIKTWYDYGTVSINAKWSTCQP